MKLVQFFALIALLGCNGSKISFDLASVNQVFRQNDIQLSNTIDILWVVDNSGSMQSSQDNLRANFSAFMNEFIDRDMDFQMAVITTDAYRAAISGNPSLSEFKDRSVDGTVSGHRVITPMTPDPLESILINLNQGITGHGDERAFQSILEALGNPANTGFIRERSYLAVVILSDEDDFSHDGSSSIDGQYSNPGLHSIARYVDALTEITNSVDYRKFSVSAITIGDQACLAELSQTPLGQKIGRRYIELAQQTDGIVGSLCGNFAMTLSEISARILQLITGFRLERTPRPGTLRVFVNGAAVPEDMNNGWTYDSERNMVIFHGSHIPGRSAIISVSYHPWEAK